MRKSSSERFFGGKQWSGLVDYQLSGNSDCSGCSVRLCFSGMNDGLVIFGWHTLTVSTHTETRLILDRTHSVCEVAANQWWRPPLELWHDRYWIVIVCCVVEHMWYTRDKGVIILPMEVFYLAHQVWTLFTDCNDTLLTNIFNLSLFFMFWKVIETLSWNVYFLGENENAICCSCRMQNQCIRIKSHSFSVEKTH